MKRLLAIAITVLLSSLAVQAQAQNNPNNPLVQFVQEANASDLQRAIGFAVANICPNLGGFGQPDSPQRDLFLRCNEMIGTATTLRDPSNSGVRSLGYTSDDELLAALQQIWGEELHSNGTLTSKATNGQFSNIAGRLNAIRVGGAGSGIGGQVASLDAEGLDRGAAEYGRVSADSRAQLGGAAQGAGSSWGWFLEGSFATGDRDQTANEDGFDFDSTSLTLGVDYRLPRGVIGVSVGFDNFDADFDSAAVVTGGDVEVEGTSGSVFGAWFGEHIYIDALLTFGSLDNDVNRNLIYDSSNQCSPPDDCPPQNRSLLGETDGDFLSGGATLGYDATRGNWDFTTSLSLAYRDIDIDGYDETDSSGGGLALRYDDQTIESFRSILSFAMTGNFSRDFGILSPHFRAEWHHEFQDDPIILSAKYVIEDNLGTVAPEEFASPSCLSCVRFSSDAIDTDFGLVGVGLTAVFANRIQVYGLIDTLIGIDNLSSTSFSIGLRGQF